MSLVFLFLKIIVYCPKLAYVEKERERRGDTGKANGYLLRLSCCIMKRKGSIRKRKAVVISVTFVLLF